VRRVPAAVLAMALSLGAVADAQTPAARQPGDQHVRVEWQPGQSRRGLPTVWGHVHNLYGGPVGNVRLSIQEIDAGGRALSTTIGYVDGVIPPTGYAYFEIRVPRAATEYRVIVLHYDLITGAGSAP
jgi:hypothetical protein